MNVDRITDIEQVKKLFGLSYDSLFADRKTCDELFEERKDKEGSGIA